MRWVLEGGMEDRYDQSISYMQMKISKDKYIFLKKKSISKELGSH